MRRYDLASPCSRHHRLQPLASPLVSGSAKGLLSGSESAARTRMALPGSEVFMRSELGLVGLERGDSEASGGCGFCAGYLLTIPQAATTT